MEDDTRGSSSDSSRALSVRARSSVLCEPSAADPEGMPVMHPEGWVHLVGLGREVVDPRTGRKTAVGGACTFGTCVEMVLLELEVPYVLHALHPDAKAAWYGRVFEKTFTPAMYVGEGQWMQETADIVAKVLADHSEQAVRVGLSERDAETGEVRLRPSLLPEEYTPMQNLLAGWYFVAHEPCDEGSVKHAEQEQEAEAPTPAARAAAFQSALDVCVEKLGGLDEHLSRHAYCCGARMGVDDVMRFAVLHVLLVMLGELWGYSEPVLSRLPHVARWMRDLRERDSNPFKYVHDDELYYLAHREWWSKKMPERQWPSVESVVARLRSQKEKKAAAASAAAAAAIQDDTRGSSSDSSRALSVRARSSVLCEPSAADPEGMPVMHPEGWVHLVGLGREVVDPRTGRKTAVGGACTFGTCVEMVLLELEVPYVLHALHPDAKAAWYGRVFEKTFTPAMYVGEGQWMQETADIVAKVLADHSEQAVRVGLSERDAETGEVRLRPSLLPEEYTPMQNLLAGWYFVAHEPCDEGSVKHAEQEQEAEAPTPAARAAAFQSALDVCVEKLGGLDEHLSRHAYCCGARMGVDDVMRFAVLHVLLVMLGELWGYSEPVLSRLPHVARWMRDLRERDSNPFKYVHDDELYYLAHREWWSKKMPERQWPSVESVVARLRSQKEKKAAAASAAAAAAIQDDTRGSSSDSSRALSVRARSSVLCEPSAADPEGMPVMHPEGWVHLVGLGREVVDPRTGRKTAVGGACTFGTCVEMVLLELEVPYVLHALHPDAKAAWYGRVFEKTFTPAMYVGEGQWMQETADIVAKVLADHSEQAVRVGLSERDAETGEVRLRPSLLPEEYTPMQNLLAGWYFVAHEPCDEGSVKHAEQEQEAEAPTPAARAAAFQSALDVCVEKLGGLDEHLSRHAYCCGARMGVDDVMRFAVLHVLLVMLGELWGYSEPVLSRLPHVARWMRDLRERDSNPFKYVHDDELYYLAHREWWSKKMPERQWPSVESVVARLRSQKEKKAAAASAAAAAAIQDDTRGSSSDSSRALSVRARSSVLCEPSAADPEGMPVMHPEGWVHLVGLGREVVDPRTGRKTAVGGACTFGTCVEMVLLELEVPYVLHALHPDAKAAWYGRVFEKTFTPAMYVGEGQWMQETADIVAKVLADHSEQAVRVGLSERDAETGEVRLRPSLLPEEYTPMQNLLAGWYFVAHEPCDEGSVKHAEQEQEAEAPTPAARAAAFQSALDVCVEKLGGLDEHLSRHAYCCGARMGVDDVMRFAVLHVLLVMLGELWGYSEPVLSRLPHVARWMRDLRERDSNPFKYVHDDELYYLAHREWWSKKMPERQWPSVESVVARLRSQKEKKAAAASAAAATAIQDDTRGSSSDSSRALSVRARSSVLCEPSAADPEGMPVMHPEGWVHLVGLGREVVDPRTGRKTAVGGACTFGTCVEMVLLELEVPYVLHALHPDAKAAWYGRVFEKTFTPAMYVGEGQWMQETADIVAKVLADHSEQAVRVGLSERDAETGEVRLRPSLLPEEYTPMQNLLAGWYFVAHEPCDEGSVKHAEQEQEAEAPTPAARAAAFQSALDVCVEKLGGLDEHLSRHAYCCGARMGVDDVMRFAVLHVLLVMLGELWGYSEPVLSRLPHVARWMRDLRERDSNPFKYVHDDELYYLAHREWWSKKMPERQWPSVESVVARLRSQKEKKAAAASAAAAAAIQDDTRGSSSDSSRALSVRARSSVLCEPSAADPEGMPVMHPEGWVHLVGLGREVVDPRTGRKTAVGGACTFGTCVEMVLLELEVPYVLHALHPDAKAAWYGRVFEKTFTPAMYVGEGQWMQETADIVAKVLADHSEQAVRVGLSERDAETGEVRLRPSLLPEEYTPMQNLLAGWYFVAHEPCDEGSVKHAEQEQEAEAPTPAARAAAFQSALDVCVEKLGGLDEHLSRHAYCCGARMGVDDVMRFAVLHVLLVMLGELWGYSEPVLSRLPHVARWMRDLRERDSNPFKYVHDDELYYLAHREWWSKKMPERQWPSVESVVARLRSQKEKKAAAASAAIGVVAPPVTKAPYTALSVSTSEYKDSSHYVETQEIISAHEVLKGNIGDGSGASSFSSLYLSSRIVPVVDTAFHGGLGSNLDGIPPSPQLRLRRRQSYNNNKSGGGALVAGSDDVSAGDTLSIMQKWPLSLLVDRAASTKKSDGGDDGDNNTAQKVNKKAVLHNASISDPYWYMLDIQLGALVAILVGCYATLILSGGLVGILLCDPATDLLPNLDEDYDDYHPFLLSVMNTATSIVTMSAGSMTPATAPQFWFNTFMQLVGVIWNVLIFSVIVTRFQHPQVELVFSKIVCTKTRDGSDTLVFRIGNKRGNYIFSPEVHVYVVSREKTLEGEFFIKSTEVPLKDLPPLISGTFNVVADISPGTALFDIVSHANVTRSKNGATADALHDDWDAEKDYSLLVTMCGFDDTYKSEVRTFHKYWPKDVYTNFEFDDSIKISASGVPYIDWVSFHQASRIGVRKDRPMEFIARGSDKFTTVTPPELFPSSSFHLFGLGDEIIVNKERVLVGSGCKYTLAVEMLLRELRVPYMLHVVQQPAKGAKLEKSTQPAWYRSQQVPGSSVPVLCRRGKWMQETLSIMDAIIQDSPLQAVDSGMRLRKSMLHPLFTPERCNTIVMKYLNHEAYDEGSVRHLEGGAGKFSSTPATAVTFNPSSKDDEWYRVNPSGALLTGERREMAIMHACELCSEELSPLEAHLRTYPYCCGDEPGPDDFLRFNLLYTCLFVLAPLWRLDAPLFRGCPCIHQWLLALAERDSSPYGEEGEGRHDVSQSLIMEGNKFKRLLPNRYFASHRLGLQRDLVVEPSGPSPTAPPALYPDSILHVFGQGVKVSTGAFRNAPTTVGSMCLHTVALEMVLRELRIPYVLHLLPHTAAEVSQRAPWFTDTFRDSALIKSSTGSSGNPNTPAVYFKGRFYSTEMMQRLLGVVPSKEQQQRKVEEALGGGGSNDGIDASAIIIAYLVQQYLLEDGNSSYEDYDESRAREVLEFSTRRLLLGASHHSYNAHDHRHASEHSSRDDANGSLFMPQYSVSPSSHVAFEVMHAAGLAKSKETHYIPRAPLLPPGSPSAKGVPATTANSSPGKLSDILSRSLHSPGYGSKDDYEGGHVDSSSLTLDECVTAIFEYLNHAPADEGAEATLGGSGGNSKSNSVIDDPDWDKQSSATGGSDGASSSLSQTGGSASSSRIINRASTKVGGLSQAVRRTPQFEDALKTVVQAFAPMETHLQSHSYLCGDGPGADDFVRFSHLQPMLYIFAPLWGYDTPLFKKLPAIEAWCAKLQERDSNPFNELYHNTEHLYATGLNARREYSNRYIPDTAIGIGLGSLTDSSLKSTGAPVVKRKAKKKAASNLSSNICV